MKARLFNTWEGACINLSVAAITNFTAKKKKKGPLPGLSGEGGINGQSIEEF